jgi:hypothetical protein
MSNKQRENNCDHEIQQAVLVSISTSVECQPPSPSAAALSSTTSPTSSRARWCFIIIPIIGFPIVVIYLELALIFKLSILFISFFIPLWLLPGISRSLNARPLYIGDIENSRFESFYINIMNLVLAIGCAVFFENWVIRKLMNDKSFLEITALVGGNITFFNIIQNYFAKMLLSICHGCKLSEEARSRRNSLDQDDEDDEESHNCSQTTDRIDATRAEPCIENPIRLMEAAPTDTLRHSPNDY